MNAPTRTDWIEAYRIGFETGLLSVADLIAWADAVLMHEAGPDPFFTELALSGSRPNDLPGLFRAVTPPRPTPVPTRAVLGLVGQRLRAGRIDNGFVGDYLRLKLTSSPLTDTERDVGYWLGSCHELPEELKLDAKQLRQHTHDFLALYADFDWTNYTDWPAVNVVCTEKLARFAASWSDRKRRVGLP